MENSLTIHNEELHEQIMNLSACNYTPTQIALQLGLDKKIVWKQFLDKKSNFREAFEAGKLKATFSIMNKQRELAESGNITAAQIFLKETKELEIANIRDRILYGHEID